MKSKIKLIEGRTLQGSDVRGLGGVVVDVGGGRMYCTIQSVLLELIHGKNAQNLTPASSPA